MIRVFVYGTLRTDGGAHERIEDYVRRVESGAVYGQLTTTSDGYLALIPGGRGIVEGEWLTVEDAALPIMDEWEEFVEPNHEENSYERVILRDQDGVREGWVYILPAHPDR